MPAVNESNVVALELERVLPKVKMAFEQDDKFYAKIKKKNVEKVSNRQMRIPIELRPGGAFQYFNPDGGDLGRGGGPQWDKAVVQPVFMSQNIEYTKLTQWATDDERKAVINSVRRLTAFALDEIRRNLDSQLMQAGTGVIGTINGAPVVSGGTDTYTLTSDGFGTRLIRVGMTIQVYDATLATNRGSAVVTQNDVNAQTITVTPSVAGSATTDVIVTAGITSPASLPALYGVPYHHSNASTGVWLGFDRANTPEVRSNRVNAASNPLSLPLPRLAINMMGNRVGLDNKVKPRAWMHPCQKQAYEEIGQLVSIIQKKASEEALDMYFDRMQMAGAPVETSFNWNKKRIDFVDDDVWGRGEIVPLGFYKTDGRQLFEIRSASGGITTADIFYMIIGTQTFVNNPAYTAYIDALAVPSGY